MHQIYRYNNIGIPTYMYVLRTYIYVYVTVWDQTTFKIRTYILAFDHKQATMINESQIVIAEKEKLQWLATKKKKTINKH